MAAYIFPESLNKIQQSSFSRVFIEGFTSSAPASGPSFHIVESEDKPAIFNVQFVFTKNESSEFIEWIKQNRGVAFGELFDMVIYTEGDAQVQEVRFSQGGYPQLSSVSAGFNAYRATLEAPNFIESDIGDEDAILLEFEGS